MSRLSATREFEALTRIGELNLPVNIPKGIAHNRHAIVMSIHQGDELYKFDVLHNPTKIFNDIINQYKIIYQKAHIIHGDLGEFNVLLNPDDQILIIDWPQWVEWNHPNAMEFLTRDITNICDFFHKKHNINSNTQEIIEDIMKKENINNKNDRYIFFRIRFNSWTVFSHAP